MKFQILCTLIFTSLVACNSNQKIKPQTKCFIKYDSLFKIVDTSNLEIIRGTDSAAIEVLDKMTKDGARGLLRFDSNNNLRSYAFLRNDHNDASFFLTYDSVGNYIRSTKSEVVEWIFYSPKDSTIQFTFFLCAFDRNYGDIKIESGKFKKENIVLFESEFTKLICAKVTLNKSDLDNTKKIYITGIWQDKCSKLEQTFIDSAIAL